MKTTASFRSVDTNFFLSLLSAQNFLTLSCHKFMRDRYYTEEDPRGAMCEEEFVGGLEEFGPALAPSIPNSSLFCRV
jgi:hypothetical protein